MVNLPLEDYLRKVDRILSILPPARRENERMELRGHLEEMIANRVLSGESEVEATNNALQQFGSPRIIGLGLGITYFRNTWCKTPMGAFLVALLVWIVVRQVICGLAEAFSIVRFPLTETQLPVFRAVLWITDVVAGVSVGAITVVYAPLKRVVVAITGLCAFNFARMFLHYALIEGMQFRGVASQGLLWWSPKHLSNIISCSTVPEFVPYFVDGLLLSVSVSIAAIKQSLLKADSPQSYLEAAGNDAR